MDAGRVRFTTVCVYCQKFGCFSINAHVYMHLKHTHTHTHAKRQTNHNRQAFSSVLCLSQWGLIFTVALESKKVGTSQVSLQQPVFLFSHVLYLKEIFFSAP